MVRNMRERRNAGRSFLVGLAMCLIAGLVFWCESGLTTQAQEGSFEIEATKLPANEETYDIQLTIENLGADWEGTVRLVVDEEYRCPTAYDTTFSLPQGSTKQFVVKVPMNSFEDTSGTITVTLLDKKQEKVASREFKRFLKEEEEMLVMGILSDDYSSLTYLDMGGEELYFYGDNYPIKLTAVTQDTLETTLDNLEFLVIDTYNTGVLTEEQILAIESWNYDGGILIIGTGAYAKDTLVGFQDSYLGVECAQIFEPGVTMNYSTSGYVDMSQLTLAELKETTSYQSYNVQYFNNIWSSSMGDGAVGILPYSLTEVASMGDSFYLGTDQLGFVTEMLEIISSEASVRYNSSTYNNNYYNYNMLRRMLRLIGSTNSPLNFGVLKALVILYVIFVGPVLYIILRLLKKKELYWAAVPVVSLLGIVLIFFAGRGFEVVDTRVYSVTAENLSGNRAGTSYLYCYDAKNKEWDLKLSDGYTYAGALMNDEYGYYEDTYYHHIKKEGDKLSLGIRPSSSFEDSFFYAGKKSETAGTIECYGVNADMSGVWGTVTNTTDRDFAYYVVIANNTLYVYEGLGAGESQDLTAQWPIYTNTSDVRHVYLYDFLNDIRDEMGPEAVSALSALGVGISSVYDEDVAQTIVIGVVENWNKAIDDSCSELAYGCLYVIE